MSAAGIKSKLSRGLAILSALLMVAVALLWADSYRDRSVNALTRMKQEAFDDNFFYLTKPQDQTPGVGSGMHTDVRKNHWMSALAKEGRIRLGLAWVCAYDTPVPVVNASWGDFAYRQSLCQKIAFQENPNDPGIKTGLFMRELAMPHWSLFLLFAIYPACHIVRGSLRHRRRRKLGQCIACGYDVSQSPDRCPECGTAREPSLSPTAGDRQGGGEPP